MNLGFIGYVSVNSKPDHLPGQTPGNLLKGECLTPRAQRKCETPTTGAENRAKTTPLGQLYSKIQQEKPTKHETEIMKNSTELLICLEILKHWKIKKAQSFLMDGFYGYSEYLKSLSIHRKPRQEIHQHTTLINNC